MPRPTPHGRRGQSGFTLLETMVVLIIIGLALGLVMTRGRPHSPALNARLAAAEIAQGSRVARSRAIALNRPVRFLLGDGGHSWRIDGGTPQALGSEVEVSLLTAAGATISSQARRIVSAPDGNPSGGRIELAGAQTRLVAHRARRYHARALRMGRPCRRPVHGPRGFTLLEVLVAFVIAALALSVLVNTALSGLTIVRNAALYDRALALAQSRLALEGRIVSRERVAEGDDGPFRWRVRITRIADASSAPGLVSWARQAGQMRATLYSVTATVGWSLEGSSREVRLETQRLGFAAPRESVR